MDTAQTWKSLHTKYENFCKEQLPIVNMNDNNSVVVSSSKSVETKKSTQLAILKTNQRLPGDPLKYQTWRQFVKVAYSHLAIRKK